MMHARPRADATGQPSFAWQRRAGGVTRPAPARRAPAPPRAGQPLFRELTLEVRPGRSVLLMGPNGCGKSSLFRVS